MSCKCYCKLSGQQHLIINRRCNSNRQLCTYSKHSHHTNWNKYLQCRPCKCSTLQLCNYKNMEGNGCNRQLQWVCTNDHGTGYNCTGNFLPCKCNDQLSGQQHLIINRRCNSNRQLFTGSNYTNTDINTKC